MLTDTEVYAVLGEDHIIDTINRATGRTRVYGHTEAEVIAQYPGAVRLTWEAWSAEASARQRTPITWEQTTGERYQYMLEVLPPIDWRGSAFLVGEPTDTDIATGAPRYAAYWERGLSGARTYHVASRPITRAELRRVLQVYR